ncbi:hypothetical protein TUMSATVNIG1_17220 [Vibrio nigripulchritudo]|uniref:hypothetical protein n=1 Tax=Vibrio nigripulchritudo TaxID=28173 RepID=UPI001909F946|nr:hypothetical protein [Vibrio nigripulchritudo]BCL69766.1 hypothetical protein VNTUMSATTG_17030 [Vibrio nigripulchritudo]BDU31113.1 hypothetical protein TUMSATVNIG1_17220 [Vibrio nigripulchritudo]
MKSKLLLLSFMSFGALAEFTAPVDVLAIRSYPSGNTHFIKTTIPNIDAGCKDTKRWGIFYLDDATGRAFSTLLAAKSSKQKVSLSITPGECLHQVYAIIKEVQVGDVNWTGTYR